ncbi:Transposase [Bradyrhizobium sp. Ghvi]|nr:Transposase [Bradyrhizobium sp. Ghvi]
MGRSRGGLTSKIHAVVDSNGLPVRLALSPGETHDVSLAGKLLSRLKSGSMLPADRGYDADWIRELAMKKDAWANIPPKSGPYLYRGRNRVERFFNRIKQCRRVATRYDKRTISLSFSLPRSGYGFALMSPRPKSAFPCPLQLGPSEYTRVKEEMSLIERFATWSTLGAV